MNQTNLFNFFFREAKNVGNQLDYFSFFLVRGGQVAMEQVLYEVPVDR